MMFFDPLTHEIKIKPSIQKPTTQDAASAAATATTSSTESSSSSSPAEAAAASGKMAEFVKALAAQLPVVFEKAEAKGRERVKGGEKKKTDD